MEWHITPTAQDIFDAVDISEGRLWLAPQDPHAVPPIIRISCAPKEHYPPWGTQPPDSQEQGEGNCHTTRSASRAATSCCPAPSRESHPVQRLSHSKTSSWKLPPGAKPKPKSRPKDEDEQNVPRQKRKLHQRAQSIRSTSPSLSSASRPRRRTRSLPPPEPATR